MDELRALMEAAEALARPQVVEGFSGVAEMKQASFCRECLRAGLNGNPIDHAASCVVGQVIFSVGSLRSLLSILDAIADVFVNDDPESPAPAGILGSNASSIVPVKTGVEQNFITGSPVRKIVYDVAGVDLGERLHVFENGNDFARLETHEEAAARLAGAFDEAGQ